MEPRFTLEGPTLNGEYNGLLVYWTRITGEQHKPECENCGTDMTGQEVTEMGFGWLCFDCTENYTGGGGFDHMEKEPSCDR